MSRPDRIPGAEAARTRGWWAAHRWLLARRFSQLFFLALFLTGPLFGLWIVKGSLTSSLTLDALPLTDPLVAMQATVAGHALETQALIGAAIVLVAYWLFGARTYCSWVCPVNMVTDAAHWLRVRLGIKEGFAINRRVRWWALAGALVASAGLGTIAWELVNPISIMHRGIVFGTFFGTAWTVVAAVFLFDLAVSRRGWCGHLCPVGTFYGLLGKASILRVSARRRAACDDCMDCYNVCPEGHVITPALRGKARNGGPVILSGDCTNCGRCIDVCPHDVFVYSTRFDRREDEAASAPQTACAREVA